MVDHLLPVVLLILGFAGLIKGADVLVAGAAALARRFGVSDLAVGLTVVAFGTSSPELFVNLIAAYGGRTGIAFGNAVGSNIANILLILGISSLVYPLAVSRGTVWKEIPFSLLAAAVLGFMGFDRIFGGIANLLTRGDGLVLLCFFIIFLYYSASIASAAPVDGLEGQIRSQPMSLPGAAGRVVLGLALLGVGGWLIVENAVVIGRRLGMSESVIGLTIVAAGTSLPELATSVVAVYRRNADIAVGNVVGSNIFNIFLVLGTTAVVRPVPLEESNRTDLLVLLAASVVLFLFMFSGKRRRIDRWEGGLFVCGYIAFIVAKVLAIG